MGAISFGLVLPFSFSVFAASSGTVAVELLRAQDGLQTQWREYARATITPGFSWAEAGSATAPSVLHRDADQQSALLTTPLMVGSGSALGIGLQSEWVGTRAALSTAVPAGTPQLDPGVGLRRTVISPAYLQRVGKNGQWSLAAVFAYQRFASPGIGPVDWSPGYDVFAGMPTSVAPSVADEVSYGRGLRLDVSDALTDQLRWNLGYQSRVNMDTFNRYRGVYADPGDFDIPSSARFGLDFFATSQLSLNLGVERVMYSEIRPFTSAALSRRFLALLGDATSPAFAWRDLTVYNIGGSWHSDEGDLTLRYSTREQPVPTSILLERLLDADQGGAGRTFELVFGRDTGASSRFQLSASYAPFQYVLGAPTSRYSVREDGVRGSQVEFQALWGISF